MARESQYSRSGEPSARSPGERSRHVNGDHHNDQISHIPGDGSVPVVDLTGDDVLGEHDHLGELSSSPNISARSYTNPISQPTQEDHRTPTAQWSDLVTPGGSHARSPSPTAQEVLPNRPQISIEESSILYLGGIGAHIPDEFGGFTNWQVGQYGSLPTMDLLEDDFLNHHHLREYLSTNRSGTDVGLSREGNSPRRQEDRSPVVTTTSAFVPNDHVETPIVLVSASDPQPDQVPYEATPLGIEPPDLTSTLEVGPSWAADLPTRNQQHVSHAINVIWEAPNEDTWIPSPPETESSLLAVGGANDFPTFTSQYQTSEPIGFDAQSAPPVMTYAPQANNLSGSFDSQRTVSEFEYTEAGTSSSQALSQEPASMRRSQSDGGSTSLILNGPRTGRITKGGRSLRAPLQKAKGRRRGPLTDGVRMSAREVRMRQTVCISCKRNKTRCLKIDGEVLCTACAARKGRSQGYVCALACFAHYARAASYDPVARCGLWHAVPSTLKLHRLALPETVCPDWLKALLPLYTLIRVTYTDITGNLPSTTILYEMDIQMCLDHLRSEPNGRSLSAYGNGSATLPQPLACLFIYSRQAMTAEHMLDLCDRILSGQRFFTYSLLRPDGTSLELNPLDPTNAVIIQRAAQMSYLLNCSIQVNAYRSLQEKLTAAFKGGKPTVDPSLPSVVARLACSLRFKAHLWHASGVCKTKEESEALAFVKLMCRTLAGYFLEMKRAGAVNQEEKGRWLRYPGTRKVVYDEFPGKYSEDGLHEWFGDGSSKVKEAEVDWSFLQPMQD